MTLRERLFLLSIPLLVLALFFWKTPPSGSELDLDIPYPDGWREVTDDLNEVIHLRWLMAGHGQSRPQKLEVMRQRWNLEVDPMFLSPEAMSQAQPLMLSAGDIPDVFIPGPNLRKYAENGYLMELPIEMLLEHAPNLMREINRHVPNIWPLFEYEGRNYAVLPSVWHDGEMPRLGIWRQDWLRAVGIDTVPETLEEVEEALRRFRYNDPNQSGVRDTYGMSGDLTSPYVTFTEIFGAFGVMPYNYMEQDGQVVWGGVQPGAREALMLLNRWYEEGLIHPEFLTDRWYQEVNTKFYNGRIGYVNYMSSYEAFQEENPMSVASRMRTLQPGAELAPGVPPTGPEGHRGHRVWGGAGIGGEFVFGRHMAERPRDVIRFLRMLEAIVVEEADWSRVTLGEEGVHWRWSGGGREAGEGIEFLPPFDTPQAREQAGLPSNSILMYGSQREIYEPYLPQDMVSWDREHRNTAWGKADLFHLARAVRTDGLRVGDLGRLQMTVYADIIRGVKPIEAFDDFVVDWHAQGGTDLLERARETYQRAKTVSERVQTETEDL